jgi:hypothetical protein
MMSGISVNYQQQEICNEASIIRFKKQSEHFSGVEPWKGQDK